ncbi:hypothetical protein RUND412_005204 [Rhizina undulata]
MIATIRQLSLVAFMLPALASATISFNSTIVFPAKDSDSVDFTYSGVIDTKVLSILSSCAKAYARDVPCDKWLIQSTDAKGDSYSESDIYNNATLKTLCTDECIAGLYQWRDNIRSSCSTEDVANANAAFKIAGNMASAMISYVANTTVPAVEFLYYPLCLKDLDTGAFCAAETEIPDDVYFDTESCNNSCLTQTATFYWTIYASVMGTDNINIGNIRTLCPDVDINTFPFLKSVSSSSSSSRSSGSSTSRRSDDADGSDGSSGSSDATGSSGADGSSVSSGADGFPTLPTLQALAALATLPALQALAAPPALRGLPALPLIRQTALRQPTFRQSALRQPEIRQPQFRHLEMPPAAMVQFLSA